MNVFSVPISQVGFCYNLEFENWHNGLVGYRVFEDGKRELLEGGLGFGLDMLQTFEGAEQWKAQIPTSVYDITCLYPEYQYQMLHLASCCSNAIDLLNSRPILLALICDKYSVDNSQAMRLIGLGQRQILAELGLDSTKSALKFLDKVIKDNRLSTSLNLVRSLLHPVSKRYLRFKHYTEVFHSTVILDQSYPFMTGTALGMAIANARTNPEINISTYFTDTLRLGEAIGVNDPIAVIQRLPSLERLRDLHDRWSEQRMQQRFQLRRPQNTDVPYVNDFTLTDDMQHIANYQQLCDEAIEMKHCISIYHNRIVSGQYSAFRLLSPERMTVGIKHVSTKTFPYEIDQICGVRNASPTEATRQVVYDWFERNRKSYSSSNVVATSNRAINAN
ncbi:PcfJ domain-containing protein [Vibrio rarus]|uniref:PcfJ domain-containing protein n=1 Tax=Vibrio rarus TaxID=413403 RepID=UPI0021C2B90A|nr:PcfJ domain-containing protein [Vibrio rarus]